MRKVAPQDCKRFERLRSLVLGENDLVVIVRDYGRPPKSVAVPFETVIGGDVDAIDFGNNVVYLRGGSMR